MFLDQENAAKPYRFLCKKIYLDLKKWFQNKKLFIEIRNIFLLRKVFQFQ